MGHKLTPPEDVRLNELDKEEMRLVSRRLRPDWSDEQFDEMWDDFLAMKAAHLRNLELH